MKRIALVIIFVFVLLFAACTPAQKSVGVSSPTASAFTPISFDQGLAIIQKLFPEESGVQFISKDKIVSSNELLYGNGNARFWVNEKTGSVDSYRDSHVALSVDTTLALEDARTAAKAYIQKYRNDIDFTQMTPTVGKLLDHGANFKEYEFEWRKYKEGVDIGTYAMVMLTPDGTLESFSVHNNDAGAPDVSSVTDIGEKKAVQAALNYVKDKTTPERFAVIKVDKTEKIAWLKNDRLTWVIYMSASGVDKEPIVYGFAVYVDASTGDVVDYCFS